MGKTVSIVIPAYNAEEYIERMLNSILNQTYNEIECIIVNDGSTDNTRKILKRYEEIFIQKQKVLKIIEQENGGQAAAVNNGLKYVTGEYFIWADSDDFFEPNAFECMVRYLENNKDVDLVRVNAIIRMEENIKEIYQIRKQKKFGKYSILDDYIMYREETIPCYIGIIMTRFEYFKKKNKGLDISQSRVGQNLQLIIPITYNAIAGCLDKDLYNYIIRKNSHSREKRNKIQKLKRMSDARKLRLDTINKVMGENDKKKYVKIVNKKFYERCFKEIAVNSFKSLINKIKRLIKN